MERACCDQCKPEEIVRLVRAGDREALDRVTRCYGRHLLAVGRRVCGDAESARDAVQDALLTAGQRLDQFRGEGTVEGWLVRMVANACRTRRRGRKNQADWNRPLDGAAAAPATGAAPDDDAARAELDAALSAALATLSATDRAIVLLTQLDGWSAAEVARALDLSGEEAVRARLSRARRALRAQLAAIWPDWSAAPP